MTGTVQITLSMSLDGLITGEFVVRQFDRRDLVMVEPGPPADRPFGLSRSGCHRPWRRPRRTTSERLESRRAPLCHP
jgi:hypothetical protein